jgi:hypothetical protein
VLFVGDGVKRWLYKNDQFKEDGMGRGYNMSGTELCTKFWKKNLKK